LEQKSEDTKELKTEWKGKIISGFKEDNDAEKATNQ